MTLLFSCLTPKYIVHVSDRRLTWPDGRVADDAANKAILFHNVAVFSYTGISRVGALRTDEWIAEQLIGQPGIQSAITALTAALDHTIQRLTYPDRRLAVVVDCWAGSQDDPTMRPFSCAISNFYDTGTRRIVDAALPAFTTFTQKLPEGTGYALIPMGQSVAPQTIHQLRRQIVRVMRHAAEVPTTISPESVARFMREAVLDVAAGTDRVGRNLMSAILLNRDVPEFADRPNTFSYTADGLGDQTYYAPIMIQPDMAMKGLKIYPGPPRFTIKGPPGG